MSVKDLDTRLINKMLRVRQKDIYAFLNSSITAEQVGTRKDEFEYLRDYIVAHNAAPSRILFRRQFPDFPFAKIKEPLVVLCEEVHKRSQRNIIVDMINKIDDAELRQNLDGCIATIGETFYGVNKFSPAVEDLEVSESLKERLQTYNDRKANIAAVTFTTGCTRTDSFIDGGITAPQLVVIAGDPKLGKTWAIINTAYKNRLSGKRVLLFTPELTAKEIANRYDAMAYSLPYDALRMGKLTPRQVARWRSRSKRETVPMHVVDVTEDAMFNPAKVQAKIEAYHPDIVLIDSAYYMVCNGYDAKHSSYQDNFKLAKQLKALAKKYNIPVVVVVQMKQESEKNAMQGESALRSVYGGDHWAQTCDVLLRLTGARSDTYRRLVLLANREGATFKEDIIKYQFDPAPMVGSVDQKVVDEESEDPGDEVVEVDV